LSRIQTLSLSMSLTRFDHGYWYATELKQFADEIGIPFAGRLRKDELERAIRQFLRSGIVATPTKRPPSDVSRRQPRDVDLGLSLDCRVIRYTNDAATKEFLEREAKRLAPTFRRRSGAMYRLNRWREEQLSHGIALTYRALVEEYVRLTQSPERFARVPHGRYVNFLGDFMAQQPGASTTEGIKAWKELKRMDCPTTYRAWIKARSRKP
jgi:hypothetical protein